MNKYLSLLLIVLVTGCATAPISPSDKLSSAITNGPVKPEVIDKYLSEGAKLNAPIVRGYLTILGSCVSDSSDSGYGCNFETFKSLIERGSDPTKIMRFEGRDWTQSHAIHELAAKGRNKEIRYLVEEVGISVNVRARTTPLEEAYIFSEHETVKLLYELGADPSLLTLHGQPATVEDMINYGLEIRHGANELARKREAKKQAERQGDSFLAKALVIGSVAVIAGTSDISSANKIDVISAVSADVINDTNGENTQQVYLKAKNQAANSARVNAPTTVRKQSTTTAPSKQNTLTPIQTTSSSSGLCRASLWGAYRTIYWDGSSLQCADGVTPTFDNTTFWMGQYCDERQPRRDPNKILRCQGTALESARSAAKATMPSGAWPRWGLSGS